MEPIKRELQRGGRVDIMRHYTDIQAELGLIESNQLDGITDALDAPVRRIMELPAHTVAGLGVKVRAGAFASSHFWKEDFEDADWEFKGVCSLVEAVLAMAGKSLPFTVEA